MAKTKTKPVEEVEVAVEYSPALTTELERLVGEPLDHNPDPVRDLRNVVEILIAACEQLHEAVTNVAPTTRSFAPSQKAAIEAIRQAKALLKGMK